MDRSPTPMEPFWLGELRVDPGANEIDGQRIEPKAMDVLVRLARAAPEVVTHAQLLESVWPKVVVGDNVLHQAVAQLRRTLADSARSPRFIESVPRRGYRLRVSVRREPPGERAESLIHSDIAPQVEPPVGDPPARRAIIALVCLAAVLLVAAAGVAIYQRQAEAEPDRQVPERSIAVLPFVNIGPESGPEYFAEGLSEELIDTLARNPGLKVTSRTSAFHYRDREVDLPAIARQLGVAHILEGSVRTSGDDVRVSVLLVDAQTDTHVWSATFDRRLGDVLALQEEIAGQVFDKLRVTFGSVARRPKVDPQAYLRYLEARHLLHLDSDELQPRAIKLLEDAVAIDSGFVRGWTELSRASWDPEHTEAADRYLARAVELDADDPVVNSFFGWNAFYRAPKDHDLPKAAAHYTRALAADPVNVDVKRTISQLLIRLGRPAEAVAVLHWVLSRDPLCVICLSNLGQAHLAAGRFSEADRAWKEALALAPNSGTALAYLAWSQLLQGRAEESLAILEGRAIRHPAFEWIRALARHQLGEVEDAAQSLAALEATWGEQYPYLFAQSHAMTGNREAAFAWLERSADALPIDVAFPHLSPAMTVLHDDPRWSEILERFGLSPRQLQCVELDVALPALEAD